MKRLMMIAALLVSTQAFADANSDAFNAGTSFGKANASQGTGSLKNPGAVTGAIPGYTANPPQSGYYGGVTGGDGGLSNKGQAALGSSDAGQTIIDSGTKNPVPIIDPDAPFITIGKQAEATSDGVLAGTSQQCTQTTVSKSTFEDYTCSADVAVSRSCVRDTQISGHYEERITTKLITSDAGTWRRELTEPTRIDFSFPVEAGATMREGKITVTLGKHSVSPQAATFNLLGQSTRLKNSSMTFSINVANQVVPDDGYLRGTLTSDSDWMMKQISDGMVTELNPGNTAGLMFKADITIVSTEKYWVSTTSTPSVCPDSPGGKSIGSVCSIPGGDRQVVVDGQTQTVHSDCWQYTDTYLVSENTAGTCASLIGNASCTKSNENCAEYIDGTCSHKNYTYQCQTVHSSTGLVCGGQYICKSGDCDDTNGAGDSGFDTAVAKLAGLASAAEDVKNEQSEINVRAFSGQTMSCRKAGAGFSNCCKDAGWGQDTGLAACNSDEMALGKAKAKKVTVSVGERCDHEVLGVCVQKSKVYCVFGGKLARIIQEQGRRDQLHVSFGSGDNPNCRGITVPELQNIDFDRINFADFYEDLMNNQKIPDSSVMVKQVKDRIAAQVNQQTGGK